MSEMRPSDPPISEELLEAIAERAAKKAVEKITTELYSQIGKSVVNKALTIVGIIFAAAFFWAVGKGWITPDTFQVKGK